MEIGEFMAVSATTPLNSNTVIRTCSEKHCTNVLVRPFKGNICSSCISRIRSKSGPNTTSMVGTTVDENNSNSSSKNVEHRSSIPNIVLPSSLTQMLHEEPPDNLLPNLRDSQNNPPSLPSPTQFLRALPSPQDIKRPFVDAPSIHVPVIGENSGMQTQMAPLIPPSHFSLHGEFAAGTPMLSQHGTNNAPKNSRACQRCSLALPTDYARELCPGCLQSLAKTASERNVVQEASFSSRKKYEENAALNADAQKHALSILSGNPNIQDLIVGTSTSKVMPQEISSETTHSQWSDVDSNPRKRLKISPPQVIDLTDSPTCSVDSPTSESPSNTKKLFATKSVKNSSRSLKLCSTANCTGTIPLDSTGTRCLSCIRKTWKSRRSNAASNTNRAEGSGANTQEIIYIRLPAKSKKKKGVTWADESDSMRSQSLPTSRIPSPDLLINQQDNGALSNEIDNDDIIDSKTKALEDIMNIDDSSTPEQDETRSKQESIAQGSQFALHRNLRKLPERPILHKITLPAVDVSRRENKAESEGKAKSADPLKEEVSGWDSDLTDISTVSGDLGNTDSGSSESDNNNDIQEDKVPSTSTGLKIRIPARPAGSVFSRQCASSKCNQPLAVSYRWKSCVMCRARSREYQRKRQNLQGKHARLDDELLEAQNIGTPLSKDLFDGKAKLEEDVTLLPGARLCSNRNCTFIIPPVEDYHWKMCSLCRIRAREQRKEEKFASMLSAQALKSHRRRPRKKKSIDANFLLRSLDYLSRKGPKPGSGRCQSVDCGMLVPNDSLVCSQCSARRQWLLSDKMNNQTPDKRVVLPMKQGVKTPRGPPPYQEYKCFNSFLLEFKTRLSGFIETQSIFFLFKPPSTGKALFSIDGEFSVVANDFEIIKRREEVDKGIMKFKNEIEYVGRIRFNPRRLMSILDAGGIAVRFSCLYPVPILQPMEKDGKVSVKSCAKIMQCELEIAVLPDHSHRLIPGQRTIIRFRLFG